MRLTLIPRGRGVRGLVRQEPCEYGFRLVKDGQAEYLYELTVDTRRLESMALAAARNQRGRSVRGPLTIRIIERARKG